MYENYEKNEFRPHTNDLKKLGGWKLDYKAWFDEKRWEESRAIEKRLKYLSEKWIGLTLYFI